MAAGTDWTRPGALAAARAFCGPLCVYCGLDHPGDEPCPDEGTTEEERVAETELIEDRLDKLAVRLRREGVIHGPERDLMIDAALVIRGQRETLRSVRGHVAEANEAARDLRAALREES